MFQLDRHKKIYDYIVKNKNATVNELADICEVATMTIRRDLDKMEKDGLITRVFGGDVRGFKDPAKKAVQIKKGKPLIPGINVHDVPP